MGNRTEVVSIQRLKPAITTDEVTPELPPRRGRPPRPIKQAPPAPPGPRERPQKPVNSPSAMSLQKKKKSVIFGEVLPDSLRLTSGPYAGGGGGSVEDDVFTSETEFHNREKNAAARPISCDLRLRIILSIRYC